MELVTESGQEVFSRAQSKVRGYLGATDDKIESMNENDIFINRDGRRYQRRGNNLDAVRGCAVDNNVLGRLSQ